MCLSSQALFVFISLLSPDIVSYSSTQIQIDAEVGPVIWIQAESHWCIRGDGVAA